MSVPKKKSSTQRWHSFHSPVELSTNRLWGAHVEVPRDVVAALTVDGSKRVVFSVNDSPEIQRALLPQKGGRHVLTLNKPMRDRLRLKSGMRVSVRVRKDESTYGLPMPEEFEELLRQDKDGDRIFHALTRGKQRTLLYIIDSAKDVGKRLDRANVILRHLKANKGNILYRKLGEEMKKMKPRLH